MNTTSQPAAGSRPASGRPISPPSIAASDAESAPRLADASRSSGREEFRDFVRERPREPHEKYDLTRSATERGMDYQWVSTRIPYSTQINPRLQAFRAAGWHFVRSEDFPELSGYVPEAKINARNIELGLDREVRADDPVIKDNMVLMKRPKTLTREAEDEQKRAAQRQISEHLRRQKERSDREIGPGRTTMTRTYGAPDEAPADAATEI